MFYRNYVRRNTVWSSSFLAFLAGIATWAIFGNRIRNSLEKSESLRELKNEVADRASQLSDLTRDKYDDIVEEVTDRYGRLKGISENELKDLTYDLRRHWEKIKSAWNKGGDIG